MRGKSKLALKDKEEACKDFHRADDLKDAEAADLLKENKCK